MPMNILSWVQKVLLKKVAIVPTLVVGVVTETTRLLQRLPYGFNNSLTLTHIYPNASDTSDLRPVF